MMSNEVSGSLKGGSVYDMHVSTGAAIAAEKLVHTFVIPSDFNLSETSTPVSKTVFLYRQYDKGKIMGFHAAVTTPGSSASVTVDLQSNGVSVLGSVITMTNTTTANEKQDATVASATLSGGEMLTAVLTVSSSTGMEGVKCWLVVQEYTSPQ